MDVVSAAAAAAVAAVFTVALVRRYVARGRTNPALLSWAVSLAMFALASAALALGAGAGWTGATFRVFYLFGGVLVVPWLAVGTAQTAARDAVTTRVLGLTALVVGALFVPPLLAAGEPSLFLVSLVLSVLWGALLLAGPKDGVGAGSLAIVATFSAVATFAVVAAALQAPLPVGELPDGAELLAPEVRAFAVAGNALGAVLVVVGAVTSAVRLRGRGTPHLVVGNLLIGLGVLAAASGGLLAFLGDVGSHAVAFAVGVSIMYAGFTRTTVAPAPLPAPGRLQEQS